MGVKESLVNLWQRFPPQVNTGLVVLAIALLLFIIFRGCQVRLSIPGKNSPNRSRSSITVDMGGSTSIRSRRKSKKSGNEIILLLR